MKKNASNDARAGARADDGAEKGAKNATRHARADEATTKREPARTPLEKKKRMIVDRMQKLGVYRVQYMAAINRTAEMYVELDRLLAQYEAEGHKAIVEHTNKAGATNLVKSPIRCAIEDTYRELLAHERELGLTPAAMKKLGDAKPESQMSPLEAALKKLSAG